MVGEIINKGKEKEAEPPSPFESDDEPPTPIARSPVAVESGETEESSLNSITINNIVDRVTNNITGTLQTLIVSDRVAAAERNSDDWKRLCQLMANNPEIINTKMMISNSPNEAFRQIGADLTNLNKASSK